MTRLATAVLLLAAPALTTSSSAELATVLASAHELRASGAFTKAEAAYRAAAAAFPDRAEPLFYAGIAARASGKDHEAIAAYNEALRIDEGLAEAHVRALSTLNHLAEKAAHSRVLLARARQLNLASILSSLESSPATAVRHYRRALALREWPASTTVRAEYNAAVAHHAIGDASSVEAATAALRRALRLEPNFEPASELLSTIQAEAHTAAQTEAPAKERVDASEEQAWVRADGGPRHDGGVGTERADVADAPTRIGSERAAVLTEPSSAGGDVGRCEWQQQQQQRHVHCDGDVRASETNASALHAAAVSLRHAAQQALADPCWPAATRRTTDGRDEAQLLAALTADLSSLLARLLASPAAHAAPSESS
jgi:tetratricopeptide (TPR) repeat protein